MVWLALAALTVCAIVAATWPILRARGEAAAESSSETQFYRAQLGEIARDVERGQLPEVEAAAARTEAARRLLGAVERQPPQIASSPRTRWAATVLIALGLPAVAFALYAELGHPGMPDEPLAGRQALTAHENGVEAAVAGVEARLLAAPDDGKGWAVIAPVYMRLGRFSDAVHAYSEDLRLNGENAGRRSAYGEALVGEAGGVVTAKAREAFEKALAEEPRQPQARFYLALGAEQDGKKDEAIGLYEALLGDTPKGAPWVGALRARLAALKGEAPPPDLSQEATQGPDESQQAMIRGMVERLANRLAANGGDVSQWGRLIRAYSVLHETDKAQAALADARKALAADSSAMADLDALAQSLNLGDQTP